MTYIAETYPETSLYLAQITSVDTHLTTQSEYHILLFHFYFLFSILLPPIPTFPIFCYSFRSCWFWSPLNQTWFSTLFCIFFGLKSFLLFSSCFLPNFFAVFFFYILYSFSGVFFNIFLHFLSFPSIHVNFVSDFLLSFHLSWWICGYCNS